MNDHELLQLAAKAAGYEFLEVVAHGCALVRKSPNLRGYHRWAPLTDDGDALRLAVKLQIEVRNFNGASHAGRHNQFWCTENWFPDGDPFAATRRAITRAAAELARAQGEKQ